MRGFEPTTGSELSIFMDILWVANIYMHYLPALRLFFQGGACNEYRVREDLVEFRVNDGPWRVLDESDIELHYRFGTEVAKWLRKQQFRIQETPATLLAAREDLLIPA